MEPVYNKWWLPIDISTHGPGVDSIILFVHIFMLALFVGWGIFFVYCLVKFRARPGQKAQYHEVSGSISKAVEGAVIVIEIVLLLAFSMPVWAKVKNEFPKDAEAEHVRIIAQQFQWNFHYPGKDGKFGKTKLDLIDDTDNPIGLDRSDEAAKDDFVKIGVLTVPMGKPIVAALRSKDVIHSFKIPVARFTHDANPGAEPRIWFQLTTTSRLKPDKKAEEATQADYEQYDIACAQLCGIGHTKMRAGLVVLPQAAYDAWYAKQR